MKKLILVALASAVVSGTLIHFLFSGPTFEKRLSVYASSAEWGCYQGVLMVAYKIKEEDGRYDYMEQSLKFCPKRAEAFKEFLRNGK